MRHVESTKNVSSRTASLQPEPLTDNGHALAKVIAQPLADLCSSVGRRVLVVASDTDRATGTARPIADGLGLTVRLDSRLRSILIPETAGLAEPELERLHPRSAAQLRLYRSGLFNSYNMELVGPHVPAFEEQVISALNDWTQRGQNDIVVVVAHRSVITAALMQVARQCGYIPHGFYGYVPLAEGCASLVRWGRHAEILFVNEAPGASLPAIAAHLIREPLGGNFDPRPPSG